MLFGVASSPVSIGNGFVSATPVWLVEVPSDYRLEKFFALRQQGMQQLGREPTVTAVIEPDDQAMVKSVS